MDPVVYRARRIITMNPACPEATHVAVRDGRILGVGSSDELACWGGQADDRFADHVLLPGFIEGHGHVTEGVYWRYTYCGYFDRADPAGKVWTGSKSIDQVIERLKQAQAALADPTQAMFAWGLDPLYFGAARVTRHDLDRVSTTRPIAIIHASGHIVNANTLALERAGYMRPGLDHPGIALGADGLPTGELRGPDAFTAALMTTGVTKESIVGDEAGLRDYARLAVRAGVTTSTDLSSALTEAAADAILRVTEAESFPIRLVPAIRGNGNSPEDLIRLALSLRARSTDRLRMGAVKLVADGSIQGFSARLREPGYANGAPQGLWYLTPEWMQQVYDAAMREGVQVHTHTNGDQAIQLAIECTERALRKHPWGNHRFTLQHCQLAGRDQLQRMRALGLCANFFANHHFYWGDAHYASTVGPERAQRMNPCRSAGEIGVPYSIHSDAPVTPLGPLHVAWCAVNRLTAQGRRLGDFERISVKDALSAITLGAAYTLGLEAELGSIEAGKRADFAVLQDDPLEMPAERLKQARVWGTVQGGRVFEAALA